MSEELISDEEISEPVSNISSLSSNFSQTNTKDTPPNLKISIGQLADNDDLQGFDTENDENDENDDQDTEEAESDEFADEENSDSFTPTKNIQKNNQWIDGDDMSDAVKSFIY